MINTIQIYCKNNNTKIEVPEHSSLLDIYDQLQLQLPNQVICAKVNNRTEDLDYRVYNPKDVEFLTAAHPSGMRTYMRSLSFVLYKAVEEVIPGTRLRIEHSVSKGYFCALGYSGEITVELVEKIKQAMHNIICKDIPFLKFEEHTEVVIEKFRERGFADKVALLETSHTLYTTYYQLGNLIDTYYSCLVPSTGYLSVFNLIKYDGGLLLVPPNAEKLDEPEQTTEQPKMLEVFKENIRFNHIAGLSNVGNLNKSILDKQSPYLIKVTESLQEKRIAAIADDIAKLNRSKQGGKIILISGPSSSGKTTFSKRLGIQLMTNLLMPVTISLDDYFLDREKTPLDENGEYDFESLYALDLELFNSDLTKLLNGEEINLPTFNFELGQREYKGNKLKLSPSNVLIMEGIHALNPDLTNSIPNHLKYKIYVSALTAISIDNHNRIPTTDNRLLRRIIRDHKYRGSSAKSTIARWASVRRGEDKWIFPYQENADAMFNSALLFEFAVLKAHAEPVLRDVPKDCAEYGEADRLLKFLDYFQTIEEWEIPPTSLIREFLGGSSFIY